MHPPGLIRGPFRYEVLIMYLKSASFSYACIQSSWVGTDADNKTDADHGIGLVSSGSW
jgi:hypothetical protein